MPEHQTTEQRKRSFGRRERVIVLTIIVAFLFALLFVLQAFDTLPILSPASANATLILFALTTLNFTAFVVLLAVLARNIIKLQRERRELKPGARFKVRLVTYSIALSLLPALWVFFITAGLLNRSVDKWFSLPAQEMVKQAGSIQQSYVAGEQQSLQHLATTVALLLTRTDAAALQATLQNLTQTHDLSSIQLFNSQGGLLTREIHADFRENAALAAAQQQMQQKASANKSASTQLEEGSDRIWLIAAAPMQSASGLPDNILVLTQLVPPDLAQRAIAMTQQSREYDALKLRQRAIKRNLILSLGLMTIFALFVAIWMALHIARTIADPVRQLIDATQRIRQGDLAWRTEVVGNDELASLAVSFNEMTAEVGEKRHQLEKSAEELQRANAALSERRRYIETVLQSLSAGVISLDEANHVTTINEAAFRLLQLSPARRADLSGKTLESLLPEAQREELWRLIRRAARLNSITREVHFTLANNVQLDAAVTVSALHDPQGEWRGTVIVLEDLSDLIEAQRRAAWSEIARRMAHEIKNPLTPIRLSAERLARNLLRGNGHRPVHRPVHLEDISNANSDHTPQLSEREQQLVRECTTLISDEVTALQRMVDEFSSFARLPRVQLTAGSLNEIVASTIRLYDERLDKVKLEFHPAPHLPLVMIDEEQIKRALVNLIDNAAEAMENTDGERRIVIETHAATERETVELIVADTGPGIAPENRERVFDPYFSMRHRGTGLGLAIVSRTIAEHHGRIRVQENFPRGAKFVIELPQADDASA
jgi:PAS domain S-box-containing protein